MHISMFDCQPGGRFIRRAGVAVTMSMSLVLLSACGGGSSSSSTPMNENGPGELQDDQSNLRGLDVSFTVPEQLQLLGVPLTSVATAGGTEQVMQAEADGSGYKTVIDLPPGQQVQVYVAIRRTEDNLLLASAEGTAWIGETGSAVNLPEQNFVYDFDYDGDGVFNLLELERGTSPTSASLDYDADGLPDDIDRDDDNDGVPDDVDAFPFNGQEYEDTDSDGIGNNTDPDDDGDGVVDDNDAFPLDANEVVDSDSDGIGDNADTDADGNGIQDDQEDSDGDGVPDPIDLFPNDYYESADADGDGIGDNSDRDDDNNGIVDFREGSQIIVPYVDDANVVLDGIWDTGYRNNRYYDEWGKAADSDSYGYSLGMNNLQVDNSGISNSSYYYGDVGFEMMHDGEYLYVKIVKYDEELQDWFSDSTNIWEDDSMELYFDVGYDQLDTYGDSDYQRLFRFRDNTDDPTLDGFYSAGGMVTDYSTSYRLENSAEYVYQQLYEVRVKLDSIGLEPGATFGFEAAVNDDDDGGDRESKWGWWAPSGTDDAWQKPSVFGKAKLQPSD